MEFAIVSTIYSVKKDGVEVGQVKKLGDGSVVFVTAQGLSRTFTLDEMAGIVNFMNTL